MREQAKRWAIVLCGIVLSGCVLTSSVSTPEGAVRQALANGGSTGGLGLQVLARRPRHHGVFALYTTDTGFGYAFVVPEGGSWILQSSSSGGSALAPFQQQRVRYGIGTGTQPARSYQIVYGQALRLDVAEVETTFSDGKIVRDSLTNGVFALVTDLPDQGVVPCELRVLDAEKQFLERIALAAAPPAGQPPSAQFESCQRLVPGL